MKTKKIQKTIQETFTKKKSLRKLHLRRFHGGISKLEILEVFTTTFLFKTIT